MFIMRFEAFFITTTLTDVLFPITADTWSCARVEHVVIGPVR